MYSAWSFDEFPYTHCLRSGRSSHSQQLHLACQAHPGVAREVAERDAELGRGRLVLLAQRAPHRELVPDWFAARCPRGESGVRVEISNLVLDLVEPLVGGERKRGALGACAGPAAGRALVRRHFAAPAQPPTRSAGRVCADVAPNVRPLTPPASDGARRLTSPTSRHIEASRESARTPLDCPTHFGARVMQWTCGAWRGVR